jgi:hypothetical protein
MAGRIFISYRREGSSGDAGRLRDYLKEVFGSDSVFIDSNIPVGVKFKDHLHDQLKSCRVFLAIIGRNWLNACDEHGHRRLDNADDWVRVEIASALDRDIGVVPVIIDDADVPKSSDLPSDLKSLPEYQAFRVQNIQFERDSAALADKLREALGQDASTVNKERIMRDDEKLTKQKVEYLIERFFKRPGLKRLSWAIVCIIGLGIMYLISVQTFSGNQDKDPQSHTKPTIEHVERDAPTIERDVGRAASTIERDIARAAPTIERTAPTIERFIRWQKVLQNMKRIPRIP